jgi:cytoskeletal protein CcmA (bactofilin family)
MRGEGWFFLLPQEAARGARGIGGARKRPRRKPGRNPRKARSRRCEAPGRAQILPLDNPPPGKVGFKQRGFFMSDYRQHYTDENDMDTVMSEDFFFDGQVSFERPLLIKGRLKGSITSPGDVYINRGAVVEAKIEAGNVWLKGNVKGEIKTAGRLELFAGSSMDGNISTPDLIIQSSCHFCGHCDMPQPRKIEESKNED